jgi:hypothetical protein
MKKIYALLAVLFCAFGSYALDSLNVNDTTPTIAPITIPAYIDSVLPFGKSKTIYVPSTYNRTDAFIVNAWNPDSNKIKQWVKLLAKNSAFRLPGNRKCVYRVKIQGLSVDSSFVCPDPYLP